MVVQIQHRRDTSTNWTTADPTLAAGEWGYETNTGKYKIGNGTSLWSALPYVITDIATDAIWAAAGDLVKGTGDNAANVLSKGAAGTILTAGASTIAWSQSVNMNVPANGTVTGLTMAITDSDADTVGQVCYVKLDSTTKAFKALATNAGATMPVTAMFVSAGLYLMQGLICKTGWGLTVGSPIYVDATTAGAITQTAPSGTGKIVQRIGFALTAEVVFFNPSGTWIELT
jgi:hypothetical protein